MQTDCHQPSPATTASAPPASGRVNTAGARTPLSPPLSHGFPSRFACVGLLVEARATAFDDNPVYCDAASLESWATMDFTSLKALLWGRSERAAASSGWGFAVLEIDRASTPSPGLPGHYRVRPSRKRAGEFKPPSSSLPAPHSQLLHSPYCSNNAFGTRCNFPSRSITANVTVASTIRSDSPT